MASKVYRTIWEGDGYSLALGCAQRLWHQKFAGAQRLVASKDCQCCYGTTRGENIREKFHKKEILSIRAPVPRLDKLISNFDGG